MGGLRILQYLDNHEPQRIDFCIECTPTDRTCQLYHHQVKIMIIYEGTNNLVSGAFLKCFSIFQLFTDVVKTLNRTEEDPVGLVISNADTLPLVHRSAIANALLARGHDTAFLGSLEKPNVASFVEGTNAPEYKYHWFVQILYIEGDSIFRCAGTVYNEKTIITSAYCAGDTEQA